MTKLCRTSHTAPSWHPTAAIRCIESAGKFHLSPSRMFSSYRLFDWAIRRHHRTIRTNYSLERMCALAWAFESNSAEKIIIMTRPHPTTSAFPFLFLTQRKQRKKRNNWRNNLQSFITPFMQGKSVNAYVNHFIPHRRTCALYWRNWVFQCGP